jgi:nitroreductase
MNDITSAPSFHEVVAARRSIRGFLPTPLPRDTLSAILEEAQRAPSNCNTQPWNVHLVSGGALTRLSTALLAAMRAEDYSLDFGFDKAAYPEPYAGRAADQGRSYYQALGVARGDMPGRAEVVERNVRFFGAPHVALLFMPQVGDNVRAAADVGMYAQTFLLALSARGHAGVPQAVLSYFADIVRATLSVPAEMKLLFGISFGTPDRSHEAFAYHEGRVPLADSVTWHD